MKENATRNINNFTDGNIQLSGSKLFTPDSLNLCDSSLARIYDTGHGFKHLNTMEIWEQSDSLNRGDWNLCSIYINVLSNLGIIQTSEFSKFDILNFAVDNTNICDKPLYEFSSVWNIHSSDGNNSDIWSSLRMGCRQIKNISPSIWLQDGNCDVNYSDIFCNPSFHSEGDNKCFRINISGNHGSVQYGFNFPIRRFETSHIFSHFGKFIGNVNVIGNNIIKNHIHSGNPENQNRI